MMRMTGALPVDYSVIHGLQQTSRLLRLAIKRGSYRMAEAYQTAYPSPCLIQELRIQEHSSAPVLSWLQCNLQHKCRLGICRYGLQPWVSAADHHI